MSVTVNVIYEIARRLTIEWKERRNENRKYNNKRG